MFFADLKKNKKKKKKKKGDATYMRKAIAHLHLKADIVGSSNAVRNEELK